MDLCQPLKANGVTGLIRRSAMTVNSTMLGGAASGAAVAHAMVLAGASFGKLEINAERLSLAVDEVAELAPGAEGTVTVAECLLTALCHVRVGPTEADDA
jgi:hypothetical protein